MCFIVCAVMFFFIKIKRLNFVLIFCSIIPIDLAYITATHFTTFHVLVFLRFGQLLACLHLRKKGGGERFELLPALNFQVLQVYILFIPFIHV